LSGQGSGASPDKAGNGNGPHTMNAFQTMRLSYRRRGERSIAHRVRERERDVYPGGRGLRGCGTQPCVTQSRDADASFKCIRECLRRQPCLIYEEKGGKVLFRPRDFEQFLKFAGVTAHHSVSPVMAEGSIFTLTTRPTPPRTSSV
jgi:hypothetical protein